VALSIFVGSGDLCWLCMVIRRPASPSPLHVALARGVCASGLCGSRTGPRGPPSPAAAEQWFQLSGVRPRVPLLPPFLSSLLLATWGFSSSCSMAVSSGAAAAGPGQDPISAHAAHLNLPPSASPPLADHPCGSAPLMAWPRGGHSPGLDTGFVNSSFSHAFSSSPSSLAHLSPAALNCSRLFSGPSLRVSFNLASWGA